MARAAAAAQLLDKSLNDLSGHAVGTSRDLDRTTTSTKKLGEGGNRAGPAIDRFSGRLGVLRDVAVTLGPALIPIGAATIPVLTASLAGLGAAAGGIGAAVLAFHGLGDALKSLDAYQLEPTAANLDKLRIELEKLGPAGRDFVRYLDDLEPTLKDLQNVARAGILPGVEDGIDGLLTRLPRLRKILADISLGMGDLARDAGESLGGPEFNTFFRYLETDARPTLEAFARSTGNVALGVANMLVAFAPLSRDFTGGLEEATAAFAKWSAGLDDNDSFQAFLAYVRESGPQVVDLLGALVSALTGLIHAAAPLGQIVVPALTGVATAFATIANSPIGPGLYTAAAALLAFNRASTIAASTSERLSTTFAKMSTGRLISGSIGGLGLLAASLTDVDDKAGLANTSMLSMAGLMAGGPWGLAIGAGIGLTSDLAAANNDLEDATRAAHDAMNSGDLDEMKAKYAELGDQIAQTAEDSSIGWFEWGVGPSELIDGLGARLSNLTGDTGDAKDQLADLGDEIGHTVSDVGLFSTGVLDAADAVENLSGALSELQGWFDKRAAIRDYRDSVKELSKSIKDGFGRKDVENLDAIGDNMIKVAKSIKDPALRQDFLAGATKSLNELAERSGPKGRAAIQRVIDKLVELGLVRADPEVHVEDHASGTLAAIQRAIDNLHGKTIKIYTQHLTSGSPDPTPGTPEELLGGPDSPRRSPRTSGHVPPLSPLDTYTSARGGSGGSGGSQSLAQINAAKGNFYGLDDLDTAAHGAATGLKGLKAQLEEQQRAYDRAKGKLDDARSRRDSISSGIQQGLGGDIWATSEASANPWAAGATAGGVMDPTGMLRAQTDRARRLVAAIKTLKAKGVTGPALLEIIGTGNTERAEMMAALPVADLAGFSAAYGEAQSALAAAGLAGGNAIEGANIKEWRQNAQAELKELREIKQALKDHDKHNQDANDRNADKVAAGVNGAAGNGHRRGRHGGGR